MGKFDKDRFQKQTAIRYCLAQGMTPCPEVVISSATDLTDEPEVLTDLDVVGLEYIADGGLRRLLFDCKTTNKMSAINRAFWAAGVLRYTGCDEAFVILKNRAVYNHRLSALTINVDLHDELSFEDMASTRDLSFNKENFYQSSIDNWTSIANAYARNSWSDQIYAFGHNVAPLSKEPWRAFRKYVAEFRTARGHFDPAKDLHIAIFIDALAGIFILWSTMGRDIRRFYDPKMSKSDFEKALRYYVWGGKEAYQLRQELRQKSDNVVVQEFPSWEKLVAFAGLILAGPHELFACVHVCRELAIRSLLGVVSEPERRLSQIFSTNRRCRQFILSCSEYIVAASGLPSEMSDRLKDTLDSL